MPPAVGEGEHPGNDDRDGNVVATGRLLRRPAAPAARAERRDLRTVGVEGPAETPSGTATTARIELVAGRLARLLRSSGPVPLRTLAGEIDALGESAIHALAERTELTVPTTA